MVTAPRAAPRAGHQVGIVPVLLGDGLPLVEHPAKRAKLRPTEHRVYARTGTVLLDYEVVTTPGPRGRGRSRRPAQ